MVSHRVFHQHLQLPTKISVFVADQYRSPGKQWHPQKAAFRPTSGMTTFDQRVKERAARKQMMTKEKELKDEKEEIRQVSNAWFS